MKLEGIHHVTAITGDAPRNLDFYTRVLGLRLVKKTVNQDDPTVYHLFYGDEEGNPGNDLTFFEYPGAPGRAGAGMVHRIVWRVAGRRPSSSGRPPDGRGVGGGPRGRPAPLCRPGGAGARARPRGVPGRPLTAEHPDIPGGGPPGIRRLARLRPRPGAEPPLLEETLEFRPDGPEQWEAAASTAADCTDTTRRRPSPESRAQERSITWPGRAHGGARRVAGGRRPRRCPPHGGDRPLLVPLDQLPRAERRASRSPPSGPDSPRTSPRSTWASRSSCPRRSSRCGRASSAPHAAARPAGAVNGLTGDEFAATGPSTGVTGCGAQPPLPFGHGPGGLTGLGEPLTGAAPRGTPLLVGRWTCVPRSRPRGGPTAWRLSRAGSRRVQPHARRCGT